MAKSPKQLAQENKIAYINACNAVVGRGGSVPKGMPAIDLAGAITNLPHDYTLAYHKVLRTDSKLKVPYNAENVAFLNRIGGMTEKSNNLIPYPYKDGMGKERNGITYTVNEDGSITVNGTATAQSHFSLIGYGLTTLPKETYTLSGCPSGDGSYSYYLNAVFYNEGAYVAGIAEYGDGKTSTITKDFTQFELSIIIKAGTTVNNIVFKPMLNSGATALPFERYFGLRPNKVTSIVNKGVNLAYFRGWATNNPRAEENLLPSNYYGTTISSTATINSIIVTQTKQGNPNSPSSYENGYFNYVLKTHLVNGKKYRVSFDLEILNNPLASPNINLFFNGRIPVSAPIAKRTSAVLEYVIDSAQPARSLIEFRNCGMDLIISNLMITEVAVTDITYKPLREPITTNIPEAVQAMEGFGEGINADYYNYIEWRDGRCYFIKSVGKMVFDGTEDWKHYVEGVRLNQFHTYIDGLNNVSANDIPLTLNNKYLDTTVTGRYKFFESLCSYNSGRGGFLINTLVATTVEEYKAYLAELYAQGNPLTIIYALAEPIETDITDLMSGDNSILVEGGGDIDLINERNYGVPSEVTYIAEIGGQSGGEGSIVIPDGYIEPSGTLEITENGTHDVTEFASVEVNVPIPDGYIVPSGTLPIATNGEVDVTGYAKANVNVPIPDGYIVPSGSLPITDNGTYDVKEKASVTVNVPKGEIVEYYDGSYEVT